MENAKPARNGSIEVLRYVCAVGIVWFHLGGPFAWVGHSALLVFIILSVYFAMAAPGNSWGRTKTLKLWLFWSAVYAGLKVADAVASGVPIASEFDWWMAFTGPALPLWFLPFIYVANGLVSQMRGNPLEIIALPILTALCVALIPLSSTPLTQWLMGASGVFLGIAVYRGARHMAVMLVVLLPLYLAGAGPFAMHLLALAVSALALYRAPIWSSMLANQLGAISLGVYVIHHGAAAMFREAVVPPVWEIAAVVVLSTAIAIALRMLPFARRFV